jgi:D-specific alpha-keto acid dehydrogenase
VDHSYVVRLQRLANVIVTPHTAYYTARALHDTVEKTLLTCLDFERTRAREAAEGRDLVRGLLGGA